MIRGNDPRLFGFAQRHLAQRRQIFLHALPDFVLLFGHNWEVGVGVEREQIANG
jgi:hypothetical protein